ncbi:GNAT family N-acetyltransferase [Paraliobacillus ryukyuensis]|nr:GNAT family N-acetyltransferase [Paraliobacillus ryukyuensis]
MEIRQMMKTRQAIKQLADIYRTVWNNGDNQLVDRFWRHAHYEGYAAFAIMNESNAPVGFVYGYRSLPGQYYHDLLNRALAEVGKQEWLHHCFEIVELAILPEYRGQGLAKQLLDTSLNNVDYHTAILTTKVKNKPARALYDSHGWSVLKNPFYPQENESPFIIMGKTLAH